MKKRSVASAGTAMTPSRRCALGPEPLQQQPDERAGGLRADNGVTAAGQFGGDCHVCLPPAPGHPALPLHRHHRPGGRQNVDISSTSSSAGWRTPRSPTSSRSSTSSRATPRRRCSSSPSPRWRSRKSPTWASGRIPPPGSSPARSVALCARQLRAQLAKPNTREQFCSAECRQQTAVPRGQSVGQLGSKDEEDLQEDLRQDPQEDPQERPRELPSSRPWSLDESTK